MNTTTTLQAEGKKIEQTASLAKKYTLVRPEGRKPVINGLLVIPASEDPNRDKSKDTYIKFRAYDKLAETIKATKLGNRMRYIAYEKLETYTKAGKTVSELVHTIVWFQYVPWGDAKTGVKT